MRPTAVVLLIVQFTSALRVAGSSLRVACDYPHPYQTRTTTSVRLAGGMATRSKVYQQAFRSRRSGGIMTVTANPFEDEAEEFSSVFNNERKRCVWEKKSRSSILCV